MDQGDLLRRHQAVLFEMLKELDRICRKHKIRYMLFAGTALGAVRHQGFVPWDDDLDVIMLREDYERFLEIAPSELDESVYYLQKEFSEHWPLYFSKLRKNNTACMEKFYPKDAAMHQGVYIDVFPCDRLSENRFVAKMQFYASKIVIAKALTKRGYLTDSFKKKVFMFFCRLLPLRPFWRFAKREKDKKSKTVHSFFGASSRYDRSTYPIAWLMETSDMTFCDAKFPVSAHYDALLTHLYGDYMTEPSEEERKVKVHAMLVDLENSYEKYLDWQKAQKIEVYGRSIR